MTKPEAIKTSLSCAVQETVRLASRRLSATSPLLIAVDGRCASGKTTFAKALAEALHTTVIHMDDFFLPPERRTAERLAEAGGNVDRERFLAQVLLPLKEGKPFSYCPYDCHADRMGAAISVPLAPVTVVEGSYSCHPALRDAYGLRIFLDVTQDEQKRRILVRNGDRAHLFFDKWIPLEEHYFSAFSVAEHCDTVFFLTSEE